MIHGLRPCILTECCPTPANWRVKTMVVKTQANSKIDLAETLESVKYDAAMYEAQARARMRWVYLFLILLALSASSFLFARA